ncbi:hypothetical protein [Streptomyces pseudovenezuelae]|uniref:Uncharacterized protein n=1 Tax=Streptomyces pseudovenezuelae TaxID=67350 RepID=A0ABT6LYZ5_9ACTN|nr:hypothetical protein [Streptomyces pseudovenezuelae]MDH6221065.1 hypothetical protein [Streptomyces pseudovenezuelae]
MSGRRVTYTVAVAMTAALLLSVSGTAASAATGPVGAAVPQGEGRTFGQSSYSPEEEAHLREVAASIWNADLAAGWEMNSDVADVLSQATGQILQCSEAFALVPRPPGFLPGVGYLLSYWKNLKDYFLVVKDNRTYRACVVTAAVNYRTAIELASMGI